MGDPARRDDEESRFGVNFDSRGIKFNLKASGKVAWILLALLLGGGVIATIIRAVSLYLESVQQGAAP